MKSCIQLILVLLSFTLSVCSGYAEDVPFSWQQDNLNFTLEVISISPDEHMTLTGVSYIVKGDSLVYGGLSAYGAVFGERGGFFTGGICAGITGEIGWKWEYDFGLFLGGGGGGSAPQGGGMMIRPYLSGSRLFDGWELGLGVSHVHFPNGEIDSTALFLNLGVDFDRVVIPGRKAREFEIPIPLEEVGWRYGVSSCLYHPVKGSKNLSGEEYQRDIGLIGVEVDYFPNDSFSLNGRLYGAWSGEIDGYAKVLFGPCISIPVVMNKRFRIEGGILFGTAGGGGVDTGGGFLFQTEIGFSLRLGDTVSLQLREGFLRTYDGDLETFVSTLGISHTFAGYSVSDEGMSGLSIRTLPWRITGAIKSYIPPRSIRNKSDEEYEPGILLMGFLIDRFLNERLYVSGRAYGAFDGEVGGYAEGLWGGGVVFASNDSHSFVGEIQIGAGGGGGMDVSSGFIGQILLGYEYMISDSYSIVVRTGYMAALNGTFRSSVVEAGLSYSFGQLVKP